MKPLKVDWRYLKPSLIWAVVFILLSVIPFSLAWQYKKQWHHTISQNNRLLQQARTEWRKLDRKQKTLQNYLQRYRWLRQNGLDREERRLDWMERVKRSAARHQLRDLRLEIGPRQQLETEHETNTQGLTLYASLMKIDFNAVHEVDTFRLLADIRSQFVGLFSTASCQWRRTRFPIDTRGETNLKNRCRLRWYSIDIPGSGESP